MLRRLGYLIMLFTCARVGWRVTPLVWQRNAWDALITAIAFVNLLAFFVDSYFKTVVEQRRNARLDAMRVR